ncbi:DegV family protein with EDD domain [Peribacillus deserti]|uniref:DegV family protein with EDD domain n=1 Tax=Peribacillus deserti TaxID=673318 RepID=A0ABS2QLV3_9BACI|nr:DegV family protein [Peribacillus deserti]MBM7693990.1 DegV family protein with EDD domain [Peribacillus deserti]
MSVHILADSASDLPLSFFEEYNVTFIPLKVHLDGKDYDDLRGITPDEVYSAMKEGKSPKTSQPSVEHVIQIFSEFGSAKKTGIYLAFSSELSGTYQTAVMALSQVKEEYPELDIEIIDTKCASLGYGQIVRQAVDQASKGAAKEAIIKDAIFRSQHMEHLFTVDNLEYLARGGRISKASAFIGGLLNIKPLLNVEDGKLIPLEKIRGKKKLFKRVIEIMGERGESLAEQSIAISHADDEETAQEWKKAIIDEYGVKEVYINSIGASIGAHVGPGTLALFFLNELPASES